MKIKIRKVFSFILFGLLFIIVFGCTNDKEAIPLLKGQLYFHFHGNIDNTEVQGLDSITQSASGRKVRLSLTDFYVSNIKLVKSDGSIYSVPDKVLLKTFWNELYLVGNVPVGSYKSVQFTIGFDSLSSLKSPISSDTIYNHQEMWFGSSPEIQGYIFLNIQGRIDTTATADGSPNQMVPFVYKIGKNAHAREVIMPDENFEVAANTTQYVHMVINYMKLFEGVDLSNSGNLTIQNIPDNSKSIADRIAGNIPNMFRYEY